MYCQYRKALVMPNLEQTTLHITTQSAGLSSSTVSLFNVCKIWCIITCPQLEELHDFLIVSASSLPKNLRVVHRTMSRSQESKSHTGIFVQLLGTTHTTKPQQGAASPNSLNLTWPLLLKFKTDFHIYYLK